MANDYSVNNWFLMIHLHLVAGVAGERTYGGVKSRVAVDEIGGEMPVREHA